MILAFCLFAAMSFKTVGIYTGVQNKDRDKQFWNRIGLYGNLAFFVFVLILMVIGLHMAL